MHYSTLLPRYLFYALKQTHNQYWPFKNLVIAHTISPYISINRYSQGILLFLAKLY